MTGNRFSIQGGIEPRVFISYARSDGEVFATDLRRRFEAEHIPLWQDRVKLEGGRDWWLQIEEALRQVEFMVMVMTPVALQSPIIRKEWRYARQQGVCIYPVKAHPTIDFASLPRWMRDVHWYDTEHEWLKLINDLNRRCSQPHVPFMVEDMPLDFVPRPREFEALVKLVLDEKREEPIAITAALRGAGGYGKTTIAQALCHDERIQEAFDDGILWITLGENPGNLIGKVEDLIYMLSHQKPGFTSLNVATARLMELLADRDILLVIDDVWNVTHLKPFLQGGKRCARLVTTRDERVVPFNAQRIKIDAMKQSEAVNLLSVGLDDSKYTIGEMKALHELAARLGEWPLLLKLVNGALRRRVHIHYQSLADALLSVNKTLEKRGLTAFDAENAQERDQAVAKTLSVSFELLSKDEYTRYKDLAIFPEDVDIPLATVQKLWEATGNLDEIEGEELGNHLFELSLLLNYDLATRRLRLHDVIRTYLQREVGNTGLIALHRQFLNAYDITRWANLPHDEPYLWDYLAEHLVNAGRGDQLVETVKDAHYLVVKTSIRNIYSVEIDLGIAEKQAGIDIKLNLLKRNVANMSHLLNRCKTRDEIATVLYSRLHHLPELFGLCSLLERELPRPFLTSWHDLPDLPDTNLIRTLTGHTEDVNGCVVSPSGKWIVSASSDRTLRIWDAQTGEERLKFEGYKNRLNGCAMSPSEEWIVVNVYHPVLEVWDVRTADRRFFLEGHSGGVNGCAVSPSGEWIVSASNDLKLILWDAQTGEKRQTLWGHKKHVTACAVSPSGEWIVSASRDKTLKIWNTQTGEELRTLHGHTDDVTACAVSPSGEWIVSASRDKTLKIWNTQTGEELRTLHGHTESVNGCAISLSGEWIVSASSDHTLRVWNTQIGEELRTLYGHTGSVDGCAISPSGEWIVSASSDHTLRVWDIATGEKGWTPQRPRGKMRGYGVSPSGEWIVSALHDWTLKMWNIQTGQEIHTLRGHAAPANACIVSPSGEWIVSASNDETLKVWDIQTGKEMRTLSGHMGAVNGCAVGPSGEWIVSASSDRTLKVWDIQTGQEMRTLRGHAAPVNACAVSPSGEWIVSASDDWTLKLWIPQLRVELQVLKGHKGGVRSCSISPSGEWIVSGSEDTTLKVWDVQTRKQKRTLKGHKKAVNGCAVSPSGKWIISVSVDCTLKLWHAQTGACLATMPVDSELTTCAFYLDDKHIIAVGERGVYYIQAVF